MEPTLVAVMEPPSQSPVVMEPMAPWTLKVTFSMALELEKLARFPPEMPSPTIRTKPCAPAMEMAPDLPWTSTRRSLDCPAMEREARLPMFLSRWRTSR
jgi:hypothetical protein